MSTHDTLIQAAANLLDDGGEQAVVLRAVGHAAGVSHNAPYKHFHNRDALLAAVAATDLETLTTNFAGSVASFWKGRRDGYRWTQLCRECGELLKCRLAIC
ncbi:TetR/AcrR family transcriptional regulator [Rhizobium etli]|uniref:TetR/AcrR family transcriptional regulator n=1 Tax=Rhizobium etli TaxID=29449 RepID=UPI00093DDCF9